MKTKMELNIVKTGINGEGIGYQNRTPIFVDGALPEETVLIEVIENHRNYKKGKLIKLLKKSSKRRLPSCKNIKICDACPYMILDYYEQLHQKKIYLEEALYKYGNVRRDFIRPIQKSDDIVGYRSECKLPVQESDGKLVTGMYQKGSNSFKPIHTCIVHDYKMEYLKKMTLKALNNAHMHAYNEKTKEGIRFLVLRTLNEKSQITFVTGKNTKIPKDVLQTLKDLEGVCSITQSINTNKETIGIFGSPCQTLIGSDTLPVNFHDLEIELSPESFFQLNAKQAFRMYDYAISKVDECETLVEAYCGIGLMSMLAHKKAKHIIGIESIPSAVKNANHIARKNNIANCQFLCMDASEGLYRVASRNHIDTLLVDPPRSGMDDAMLEAIEKTSPKKIIYISCNPSTLGKNLKVLKHQYHVVTVTPFDLFPQTPHCESVTVLEKG